METRIQFGDLVVVRVAQKYKTASCGQFSECLCKLAVVVFEEGLLCISLEVGVFADRQVRRGPGKKHAPFSVFVRCPILCSPPPTPSLYLTAPLAAVFVP